MKHITELKTKKLKWINVTKPGKIQMNALAKKYKLSEEDAIDVLPPIQRIKLVERSDYLFIILHFPVYNPKNGDVYSEEIDFFIFKNTLITVHNDKLPVLKEFFSSCKKSPRKSPCNNDMADLLYEILNSLLNYCFPMLRHINMDIEAIEDDLFTKYEKREMVEKILLIKTNIFDFQRSMQSHEFVLKKLIEKGTRFFPTKKLENNFSNLVEYTREINLSLSTFKDNINALHEANATLADHRVNQIMKVLTVVGVITWTLSLVAAVFGIGAEGTPIIGSLWGFWKITAMLGGSILFMLILFKWRRWI